MPRIITSKDFAIETIKINPFYKNKCAGYTTFESLPFTTKSELLHAQQSFPPFGNFLNPMVSIEQIYRTSGTTSKPLLLAFSQHDINYITDIGAECFKFAKMGSVGNQEIVINCLNLSMWAGGFFDAQSMLKTGVQVINFGTGNTNELIKLILDLTISYNVSLHCTPSYLPAIEKRLQSDFNLIPQALKLFHLYLGAEGGIQNNTFRQSLMDKWNAPIYNANYGMSEICSIMASANDDNILKFAEKLFEYYYVELKTLDGALFNILEAHVGDEGELILSSYTKEAQPLLRYSTKEKIRILKKENLNIYFEIIGRTDDMLVIKGINFFPEQLRSIVSQYEELTGLYQLQIYKNQNGVITDINLICELNSSHHTLNNHILREQLIFKIRNELTISLDVNFTYKFDLIGNKLKLVNFIEE